LTVAITRLTGGLTPANGADPRTFPAVWNGTADDLEAGEYSKVPSGGSAGEVLVKQSATDYDAEWGPSVGTLETFPVAVAATSFKTIPGSKYMRGNAGNLGIVSTNVTYEPWLVEFPMTLTALEVVCTTASAGKFAKFVLYAADAEWQPFGAPLADSGNIDVGTTGVKTATLGAPLTLDVGRYVVLCARDDAAGTQPAFRNVEISLPGTLVTSTGNVQTVFLRTRNDDTLRAALFSSPPTDPDGWNIASVFGTNAVSAIVVGVFSA
jgi:hypothetical protein